MDYDPMVEVDGCPCCRSCFDAKTADDAVVPGVAETARPRLTTLLLRSTFSEDSARTPSLEDDRPSEVSVTRSSSLQSTLSDLSSRPQTPSNMLTSPRTSPSIEEMQESLRRLRVSASKSEKPFQRTTYLTNTQRAFSREEPYDSESEDPTENVDMCKGCGKVILELTLRLKTGETFHPRCFKCAKCQDVFAETHFIAYMDRHYHTSCAPTSPLSEAKCALCQEGIDAREVVKFAGQSLHKKCFKCSKCASLISPGELCHEISKKPFCHGCVDNLLSPVYNANAPQSIFASRAAALPSRRRDTINLPPPDLSTITPSSIFSTGVKRMPRLGVSDVCPRCHKDVMFLEEKPGPKATKFHRKCLQCLGCKKQLDSACLIVEDGDAWLPHCRNCYDKKKRHLLGPIPTPSRSVAI